MMRFRIFGFALLLLVANTIHAQEHSVLTVTIDTQAAKATLLALENPALTHEQALRIAKMYGNQGALRKLHEFEIPSTTEDFANALYLTAHGLPVTSPNEKSILLFLVQPKVKLLLQVLDQIDRDPAAFQGPIQQRIAAYSPSGVPIHLKGYVIAAGDGGGYAFGDTDFFLNLTMLDDFVLAQNVTTHEMYHAVQGAFADARKVDFSHAAPSQRESCTNIERLFSSLYEEGSAVYVDDPSQLENSHTSMAARKTADLKDGKAHLSLTITLLEMSVLALSAPEPAPYGKVYDIDFLGHGELYNTGYAMATALADAEGPQGIIQSLREPPYMFVLRYTALPLYGKDKDHPLLGPNTIAAAKHIANGCR